MIVGGEEFWDPYLPTHPMPTLDYDRLAVVQLSFVLTRCDTNSQVWEICQIPRLRKGTTKASMFVQVGQILQMVTDANDDLPPIGGSADFHATHLYITMALLGLLAATIKNSAPFFKHGVYTPMDCIPCFPYSTFFYKEHAVFGHGDACHLQKSWVDQVRSGVRWIRVAGCWVSAVSGRTGGRSWGTWEIVGAFCEVFVQLLKPTVFR